MAVPLLIRSPTEAYLPIYHFVKIIQNCIILQPCYYLKSFEIIPSEMGFEPTRAEHIGLAVQRLNHSATSSCDCGRIQLAPDSLHALHYVLNVDTQVWKRIYNR
ncbi:hypothetical protein K1T71_003314 [Dendrolimus kikuchii]|uniref:Uncharacterized protein n=1 Tax=Dendrolimus kikuchii TaxID=765133 RepID=A0ACC1DBB4_9NEOP|nr:hypothetical protein K1T71_003314 [Dendrolimus kikuchii]